MGTRTFSVRVDFEDGEFEVVSISADAPVDASAEARALFCLGHEATFGGIGNVIFCDGSCANPAIASTTVLGSFDNEPQTPLAF